MEQSSELDSSTRSREVGDLTSSPLLATLTEQVAQVGDPVCWYVDRRDNHSRGGVVCRVNR